VQGVAREVLAGLLGLGHEVECYISAEPQALPEELLGSPRFTVHWSGSRWRWDRWYSRDTLSAFITGTIARAMGMRRLGRRLSAEHARHPYDVVYQFSHIELIGLRRDLRRDRLPPVVLHPETHAAGELRWVRREAGLASRCQSLPRRWAVMVSLGFRTRVQHRDIASASAVICISRCFRRHLVSDYGVEETRAVVVPNPIRADRFLSGRARPAPGEVMTIVFVGRISSRKGVDTVVELSHRLHDLEGRVRLELIGGHTLWSDYRCLLADLNPAVATWVGHLPAEELSARLVGATLAIQPSKYEPFGLTVGEALASGVPVVASVEVGAAEDVDGQCCRLVPIADAEALEAAVRALLAELAGPTGPELRRNARREAERLFDPTLVAGRVASVLAAVAAGRSPASSPAGAWSAAAEAPGTDPGIPPEGQAGQGVGDPLPSDPVRRQ
jgi:glycosyltransferase involved in cell wall biosynthesis